MSYEYDDYGNIVKKYRNGSLRASYIYDPAFLHNQWLANRKLRYTMQEADELTTNDNNNWVEWTFE